MSTTVLELEKNDNHPKMTATSYCAGYRKTNIELCIGNYPDYMFVRLTKNEALTLAQQLIEAYKL